jgi:hypothetical protein
MKKILFLSMFLFVSTGRTAELSDSEDYLNRLVYSELRSSTGAIINSGTIDEENSSLSAKTNYETPLDKKIAIENGYITSKNGEIIAQEDLVVTISLEGLLALKNGSGCSYNVQMRESVKYKNVSTCVLSVICVVQKKTTQYGKVREEAVDYDFKKDMSCATALKHKSKISINEEQPDSSIENSFEEKRINQ